MKKLLRLLIVLLFLSCGGSSEESPNNAPFADCKFGPPKAIFSEDIENIARHQFQLDQTAAVEKVLFNNGILLELRQSGCEKPIQDFHFEIPGNFQKFPDENWINLAENQFIFMGNLSESLKPFHFWANAIRDKKISIKLGEPIELEQKNFIKIDKVAGADNSVLMIKIFQQ